MKVLFISAFYPHRYDQMFGLFARKHAEAIAKYTDIKVLYVQADENIKRTEIVKEKHNGIDKYIVYYPISPKSIFHKLIKIFQFFKAYHIGFYKIKKDGFSPDIIHANILTRTVVIAYLIKMLYGVPYVITEHWSRYLPEKNGFNGFIHKKMTRFVAKRAKAIMPVSECLREAMLTHGIKNANYQIVPNVVDDFFYQDVNTRPRNKKRLIHISCFDDDAKNISGILRVVKKVSAIRNDFELIILGTGQDWKRIIDYYTSLHFNDGIVSFIGEKTPQEVHKWLYDSDCVVFFSNYETFNVVIAESLTCGKPIISTKVGIAPEVINESTGILVDRGDENGLEIAINRVLDNLESYDSSKIKKNSIQFCCDKVGEKIYSVYQSALKQL